MKPLESEVPTGRHQGSETTDLLSVRSNYSPNNTSNGVKKLLLNQMIRAKRAGTWFRLCRRERGLYTLAMRLEVKFQSHDLLKALVSVLKSLRETCDRGYIAMAKAMRIAWAFSEAAVRAGNEHAREWRNDRAYFRFLAEMLK